MYTFRFFPCLVLLWMTHFGMQGQIEIDKEFLVGKWATCQSRVKNDLSDCTGQCEYEFFANGVFLHYAISTGGTAPNPNPSSEKGRWLMLGDKLTLDYDDYQNYSRPAIHFRVWAVSDKKYYEEGWAERRGLFKRNRKKVYIYHQRIE